MTSFETPSPASTEARPAPGFFGRLYTRVLGWAGHRHAERYLAGLSFAESSFFPIPPDVMLMPMALARPSRAVRYATIATLASVAGGLFGYALGHFGAELVDPLIARLGQEAKFQTVLEWFGRWGFWVVFVAGFSPIPYKLFTVGAGLLGLALLPFTLASLIGRGARFFLVAVLVARAGPRVAPLVERSIERIGWAMVALLVLAGLWMTFGPGLGHAGAG